MGWMRDQCDLTHANTTGVAAARPRWSQTLGADK